MINKRILNYYIDRKKRNYPTEEDLKKINWIENLFQYSNWIDKVGKNKYQDIMNFLGFPENDTVKYYNEYYEMKKSLSQVYTNIYPEVFNNDINNIK